MSDRQEIPYDPDEGRSYHGLLNSIVLPRPIAWISTTSADGVDNLAPHSYFSISSVDPPVVQFSSTERKDTWRNATETGEFVVNFADSANFERINATATDFPPHVSEFDAVGIEREPSVSVRPPRVAGSPVAIECVTDGVRDFGNSIVVFGRVQRIAIDRAVLTDGRADVTKLKPLARLGGPYQWSEIGEIREISRISRAEWPGHFDPDE